MGHGAPVQRAMWDARNQGGMRGARVGLGSEEPGGARGQRLGSRGAMALPAPRWQSGMLLTGAQ